MQVKFLKHVGKFLVISTEIPFINKKDYLRLFYLQLSLFFLK